MAINYSRLILTNEKKGGLCRYYGCMVKIYHCWSSITSVASRELHCKIYLLTPQTCTNFSTRVEELKLRDFNCMLGRVVSCRSSSYRPGNTSRHSCLRLTRNKSKKIPPLMWWISFLCY